MSVSFRKCQELVRFEITESSSSAIEFIDHQMLPHEQQLATQSYSQGNQHKSVGVSRYSDWLSR